MKHSGDDTILTSNKYHGRPNDTTLPNREGTNQHLDVKHNTSNGGDCREVQETPSNQQCTSAATEEDRNVGGDDPREDHVLIKDHTQLFWPQLRGVYPGDDQTLAQNPADPSNGEKTGQEPANHHR